MATGRRGVTVISREARALRTTAEVTAALARLRPQDHAVRSLIAAIDEDRARLLRRMSAGGLARLTRPGYL